MWRKWLTLLLPAALLLLVLGGAASAADSYGAPIDPKKGKAVPIAQIFANTADYLGKNVIVEGEITQVCQTSGCWLWLSDGPNQLYVQFFTFTVRLKPGTKAQIQGTIRLKNKAPYLVGEGLQVK